MQLRKCSSDVMCRRILLVLLFHSSIHFINVSASSHPASSLSRTLEHTNITKRESELVFEKRKENGDISNLATKPQFVWNDSDLKLHTNEMHNDAIDDFKNALSRMIAEKLAEVFKKRMQAYFPLLLDMKNSKNSSKVSSSQIVEDNALSTQSREDILAKKVSLFLSDMLTKYPEPKTDTKKSSPEGRQFAFNPYLQYNKDMPPDEKISIHDILPIKVAKFVKSMVEDAPWEQMFMKMVRMVVDQFVDRIIEKMFAHKDEEDGILRSADESATKKLFFPKNFITSIIRLRRSADKGKSDKRMDASSKFSAINRLSKDDLFKTKETAEDRPWLDSVLDYLFPDDPKSEDADEENNYDIAHLLRRRKRAVSNAAELQMSDILNTFLKRYRDLSPLDESKMGTFDGAVKDSVRRTVEPSESLSAGQDGDFDTLPSDSDHASDQTPPHLLRSGGRSSLLKWVSRAKRFAPDDFDETNDALRLWQAAKRKGRPSNHKTREECSLRKACNAGRLLSRIPSVEDITLQLKSYGDEPHWDAFLWGMSKKKCFKIYCKRQRSPKGSKKTWIPPEKEHFLKTTFHIRKPKVKFDENDLTTVFPV